MNRLFTCTAVIILALVIGIGSAVAAKKWYIVKSKDGVCRVIKADGRTDQTIGGPYKSKKNAQAARLKVCEERDLPSKKKTKKKAVKKKTTKKKSKTTTKKKSSSKTKKTKTKKSENEDDNDLSKIGGDILKNILIDVIKNMDL